MQKRIRQVNRKVRGGTQRGNLMLVNNFKLKYFLCISG